MAKRLASQQMTQFPAESRASGLQDTFRQLQLGTRLLARHEPISTLTSAVHLAVQRPPNPAAPSQTPPRDVEAGRSTSSSARAVTTTGTGGGADAAAEAEAAAVAEAEPEVKAEFLLPLVPGAAAAAARGATLRPTPPTSPAPPVRRSIGFESTEPTGAFPYNP